MPVSTGVSSGLSWLAVGPWIVGAVFVWSGTIKAVAPHVFAAHLKTLGWIPSRLVQQAVVATAGLEGALGVALLVGAAPALVLPATAVLVVVLSAASWWGVRSGRTTDCGCYGGYVVPSTAQSIALNGAFVALVVSAWTFLPRPYETPPWKLVVTAATAVVFGTFAAVSQQFLSNRGRFMIDMSPLKVGRRWYSRWGAAPKGEGQEMLVSYLGPDCPHCKKWVRVLNAVHAAAGLPAAGLPQVAGVVATSSENLETFIQNSAIRFPVTRIPQTLMNRLVWGIPTTVVVSDGRIQKQWSGDMPPEFFHQFRQAFFPATQISENRADERRGPSRSG